MGFPIDRQHKEGIVSQRTCELATPIIAHPDHLAKGLSIWQSQQMQRDSKERKLKNVIKMIQGLPGLEHFLTSPTESDVCAAAVHGPIVVLNIKDLEECTALIIQQNKDFRDSDQQIHETQTVHSGSHDAPDNPRLWDAHGDKLLSCQRNGRYPNAASCNYI